MRLFTGILVLVFLPITLSVASSATVTNGESEALTLVVTENGERSEVVLAVGQTQSICPSGCFVTLPNGDRVVLSGGETVSISNSRAIIE
ncbi:MAG: hypothetical protein AAFR27_09595 [Pseudomonadota bacterium]